MIADNKIFTLDTESRLSAFSIEKGTLLWKANIRKKNEDDPVIGGGLSFSGGVLYATSGYGELLAVNPDNGEIYWRARLSAPSRAAPTIMDGRVFVSSLNNNVTAFDAKDGQLIWEYEGIGGNTSLLGSAACAADREIAIAGFFFRRPARPAGGKRLDGLVGQPLRRLKSRRTFLPFRYSRPACDR